MGFVDCRTVPLISFDSCHWMYSPAFSVYVVFTFCGAATTFVPDGRFTLGSTSTCVPSSLATTWPHCGDEVPRKGTMPK
jgi:hypothetical protein